MRRFRAGILPTARPVVEFPDNQGSWVMRKLLGVTVVGLLMSGCATSSLDYRPPSTNPVSNTKQVGAPFDQAWDSLVRQLSSDFFVINNIDKNSRLINLSFTSNKPSEFVDCGVSSRTFENARGKQTVVYSTADSAAFAIVNDKSIAFNIERKTKLDGRVNIYVAPSGSGTSVAVNTKYVVNVQSIATGFDGAPGGRGDNVFDFSTKQGFSSAEVSCYAKGTLENRILEMVN
jgi:hypothetical protein